MKREIKCPHCHEWTLWRGHIDDRCLYCGEFLETENFTEAIEKQVKREVEKEEDFLFIRANDSWFVKKLKSILLPMRHLLFYFQLGFVAFISVLLWLIGILAA